MIIIADSGSTKTTWRTIDKDGNIDGRETIGLNPYYLEEEKLRKEIKGSFLSDYKVATDVSLFFYGSGCASTEKSGLMAGIFQEVLPGANIHIHDDMLAAARATSHDKRGIVCILGTGSNSCFFDGRTPTHNVSSLGYILGDEGSGSYMGKRLLSDFVRNQIPEALKQKILEEHDLTRDKILNNVYHTDRPNRYLAGFARFIGKNIEHDYMKGLVRDCFMDFFIKNIALYREYKEVKIHFVGSVAWYFKGPLQTAGLDFGIDVGNIVSSPMDGLIKYHEATQNPN